MTPEPERTEEVQRRSEERFRQLVELMPVAVCVCDTAGIIQSYNKRAIELWGHEPKSGDSLNGEVVPHPESAMTAVLRTGMEACTQEAVIERPDGSRITLEVNIVPLRNRDGELIGAINCFQDITERKRAEEQLQRSEDSLRLA